MHFGLPRHCRHRLMCELPRQSTEPRAYHIEITPPFYPSELAESWNDWT